MEILRIEDLSFSYPDAEKSTLSGISLNIQPGEFVLLCGASGCGKTTLLRLLKKEIAPFGKLTGGIYYKDKPQNELDELVSASEIGFVQQSPDEQIVTDKVWHELAFGLENLGVEKSVIRRRVAEMANYFGINQWYHRDTDSLSGGQKQLLNLAAVMVMQPQILILDEPTAQLDPIAASEFIATVKKLCGELGVTVIIAEHRLEELFPVSDRVVVMEDGKIIADSVPSDVGNKLKNHSISRGFPSAVRIFQQLGGEGDCPLTVGECRKFLYKEYGSKQGRAVEAEPAVPGKKIMEIKDVWFRYQKDSPDILSGVSTDIFKGEVYTLIGGNGSGKTTLLNVLAGLDRPYKGRVSVDGERLKGSVPRIALLPQDPLSLFVRDTVKDCYLEVLEFTGREKSGFEAEIGKIASTLGVAGLLERHPFDLSGGEAQKCALGMLLLQRPEIFLLDEPTKGLDAFYKEELAELLLRLTENGATVIMVTHDLEFAAEVSDRCGLLFDGEIVSEDRAKLFFAGNSFYTTSAGRIARGIFPGAVLCGDVVKLCEK